MASTDEQKAAGALLAKHKGRPGTLAFLGAGNMAASLIAGLVADGFDPGHILVSDPEGEKRAALSARYGVRSAAGNVEAVEAAEVVVLAVKPQVLKAVCAGIRDTVQAVRPLVISIAAGVREAYIQDWLGGELALVRTMPNTPAMIQAGATVLHAGARVNAHQRSQAESVLRAVGLTRWVSDEGELDAVTALSGSGPAYFFLVMEAMEQAGIELGLDLESARLLTIQTALGAARMAMESSEPPAALRQRVTSPGGTTEAALEVFEEGRLRELFQRAMAAARGRSEDLADLLGGG